MQQAQTYHELSEHPLPQDEPLNTLNTLNKIALFDGEAVFLPAAQLPAAAQTLHPSHQSRFKNQVLQQEDVLKIDKARLRILWAPFVFALSAEALFWINRKLSPRKLFQNPFKIANYDNRVLHQSMNRSTRGIFIFSGMIVTAIISLFLKENQEIKMYNKYRRYVDSYAILKLYSEKQDFLIRNFKE